MTIWLPQLPGKAPIYLELADAVEAAVRGGALRAGDRLPPQRELADGLGVTLGTVTRGYAEAARRGLVRGEVGRGTVVLSGDSGELWWGDGPAETACADLGLMTDRHGADPDLAAVLRDIAGRPDRDELLHYHPPRGFLRHREAGAKLCAAFNVAVPPEQVLITAGGQHAIFVLLSALFRPGDRVAVGELNYPGLISAAAVLGIRLAPVALDAQGVVPESLDEVCARETVRGLYCMPGPHNPTSAQPTPERQRRLAKIAVRRNLFVIEDAAYALTADAPCTSIRTFAPERAFFIASVSKIVDGGLRVGFVAGPAEWMERLVLAVNNTVWMIPPLCVEIAATWILGGVAEDVLRRKLAESAARSEMARRILAGADFVSVRRGYFLWLRLPEPWRGLEFEREAARHGARIIAGDAFAVGQTPAPAAVRVSLSAARSRAELRSGLERIARLLRESPPPGRAIV